MAGSPGLAELGALLPSALCLGAGYPALIRAAPASCVALCSVCLAAWHSSPLLPAL